MSAAAELVKKLRDNPKDPDLLRKTAQLLVSQPEMFVSNMLAHSLLQPPKLESAAAGFLKKFCMSKRAKWQNYCATQKCNPLKVAYPHSLEDLKAVMAEAARLNCSVRAVGSAHAWSDVELTDGILIETHGVWRPLPVEAATLRDPAKLRELFHVEAGMTIKKVNEVLDADGRALLNMGGYDGQTVAGVISTSTHGSGLKLGSFPSMVAALVILTAEGELLQVEPANGISEPAAFAQKYGAERKLMQDDKLFNACVVGMGCLGIVYAVILWVREKYWLKETREVMAWSDARALFAAGKILDDFRHVEVLLNPHKVDGMHNCLVTTRELLDTPPAVPAPPKPFRDVFGAALGGSLSSDAGQVIAFLFNEFPAFSPFFLEEALQILKDKDKVEISHRIFNVGAVNHFMAVSSEFAIDLDKYLDAADALLDMADRYQATDGDYFSAPIAMRWVAASPGFLSMQPRPVCMFEMPLLRDVKSTGAIQKRCEELLVGKFQARPHWGQLNTLDHDKVTKLYPRLSDWQEIFDKFNSQSRFRSPFTDRVGFSK
jgi:FAD/FMN-containing dehydrogenase